MKRLRLILDPIFAYTFYVQRGGRYSDAEESFAGSICVGDYDREPDTPGLQGRFCAFGGKDCLIWVAGNADAAVLAHECYHAAAYVMRQLGVTDGGKMGREAVAYYVEWLVRAVGRRA